MLGVPTDELVGRTIRVIDDGDVGGRAMFDVFADLSALALFSQDSQGRITRWNRGAELIFGYDEIEN